MKNTVMELSNDRVQGFSDGVFSIVATLLVLEVKLPNVVSDGHVDAVDSNVLFHQLLAAWPQLLGYTLSFLTVTIWWITHHHLFHVIERTNRTLLWLNSIFLMFLALLPFPTSILGNLPKDPVATSFYGLMMIPIGISICTMRWYATVYANLANPHISKELYKSAVRKGFLSPILYFTGAVVSYFLPVLGLLFYVSIALYYFLPSSLEKRATASAQELHL